MGTHSESLQLFVFPYGNFYTLDQLGHVIMGKKQGYSLLNGELPTNAIFKDIKTKTVYILQSLVELVADDQQQEKVQLLSKLSVNDLKPKVLQLSTLCGLYPSSTFEPVSKKILAVSFKPQMQNHQRFPDGRKRSLGDTKDKSKKRLSIETRFTEKMENNTEMVDQLKSSYLVKQQQQAIIDQRTRIIVNRWY